MDEFMGQVALITGAGRGSGRQIALAFSSLGVSVAANDINPINLDETVGLIQQAGGHARGYVFDIAKRMPVEAMVTQVVDQFGRLDFLVSHASVAPDASILDMDEWDFHRTLDVNLGGPFYCAQLVGRVMQQLGGGVMVTIISAPRPEKARRGYAAVAASQAGLAGLTRAAASELSNYNIRLNAVCEVGQGYDLFVVQKKGVAELHQWRQAHPDLRLGDQPELVSLVLYLCSTAACAITGQVLAVDWPAGAQG